MSGTSLVVMIGLFFVVVVIGVTTVILPELASDPEGQSPDAGAPADP